MGHVIPKYGGGASRQAFRSSGNYFGGGSDGHCSGTARDRKTAHRETVLHNAGRSAHQTSSGRPWDRRQVCEIPLDRTTLCAIPSSRLHFKRCSFRIASTLGQGSAQGTQCQHSQLSRTELGDVGRRQDELALCRCVGHLANDMSHLRS